MEELWHVLLLLLIIISAARATTTSAVKADIAVLIVVDNLEYNNVLNAEPWPTYYQNFFDMAQNRIDLLELGIQLTLLDTLLLNETENSQVFVKYQNVWNPNLFISRLRIFLKANHKELWEKANVVILMTQRTLQLPVLNNQRTYGEMAVENICGALKIGVVQHDGLYIEVNTFAQVTLLSLGVFLDGKGTSSRCTPSEQYVMGNIPKTFPANFQFSQCTISNAKQQISVVNKKHQDCIAPRPIQGHKRILRPYLEFTADLDREKFCKFKKKRERCLWTSGNDCFVTCCTNHAFFHKLRGHSVPLPDGMSCGDGKVCINGWCKPKGQIATFRWTGAT